MKIVAVQGSPRARGNTQALLDMVLDAARSAGARTETIQLSEYRNLVGCEECFCCDEAGSDHQCAIDDDMQDVLRKLHEADAIVWATPVFAWMPSWLLKIALDRLYCTVEFSEAGKVNCSLSGRRMAAVLTSGGAAADNCDLIETALERSASYLGCDWLGVCAAGDVTGVESIRDNAELQFAAEKLGKRLAQDGELEH